MKAGKPAWRKCCDVTDEVVSWAVRGDELFLLSTRDAPNARVLRTSVAEPSFKGAGVAVPEGKDVVEGIGAARDGSHPTPVDAYGSCQISSSPVFNVRGIASVLETLHPLENVICQVRVSV